MGPRTAEIVLGMNENLIPSRPILEPLVPDSIRERLGLDSQREPRDAWLVDVLNPPGVIRPRSVHRAETKY